MSDRGLNTEHRDDLLCLALLYSAGELEETQAIDFENRLSKDQAAREAVAHAVQLVSIIDGHPVHPTPSCRVLILKNIRDQRRSHRTPATSGNQFRVGLRWTALLVAIFLTTQWGTNFNLPHPSLKIGAVEAPPRLSDARLPDATRHSFVHTDDLDDGLENFEISDPIETWGIMVQGGHLRKAMDEEKKRKNRQRFQPDASGIHRVIDSFRSEALPD